MNLKSSRKDSDGVTLIEAIVVLAVIGLLATLLLPALAKAGSNRWVNCFNNLKQISAGFILFANEHEGRFPMQLSTNEGGTKELIGPNILIPHFQAISNQLGSPKVLTCYRDTNRTRGIYFNQLTPTNISYFLNLDSVIAQPASILAGDDNLSVGPGAVGGFHLLTQNSKIKWADDRHSEAGFLGIPKPVGHVSFADGSARRLNSKALPEVVQKMTPWTNRLVKPQ